ncbi:MAG: phosphatase PAP2 family protein, partial [Fimbriimonadaceae bacterium]|nr:phosphatase PAP2 family protein [Alphaproteobacteria bacterium]
MAQERTSFGRTETCRFAIKLLVAAGIGAALCGILFIAVPELDRAFVRPFYLGGGVFLFTQLELTNIARDGFQILFAGACAIAVAGLVLGLLRHTELFGLIWTKWAYFLICAAVGPGLFTNSLLKDYWGRARPNQIVEFGGDLQFSPALYISDQCHNNCSFVSGESSTIYMLFFALALMADTRRTTFIILALVLGTLAGAIRMGQGGHFPSDIIFSGLFMAIVAGLIYVVIFRLSA